jgi:D-hydroxyproline dehydrogenase subunit alpha
MRCDSPSSPAIPEIQLDFEGRSVPARIGESIAAALTSAGIQSLRITGNGDMRGVFCGMGVCHDCLVEIDGQSNLRACMTKISGPHKIRRQPARAPLSLQSRSAATIESHELPIETPDIAVVGGGAGGLMAAAVGAEAGANVLLIDERPQLGGQFYKQAAAIYGRDNSDAQFREGAALIDRVRRANVRIMEATVWGAFAPLQLAAIASGMSRTIQPSRLIVATGAYERAPPIDGWTLAGVMTTGAAQTFLRTYRVLPGRRILIAGNGPLNFQVARELVRAGAEVVAVAELAPRPQFSQSKALWSMLFASPALVRDGLLYVADLRRRGVPVLYAHRLAKIVQTPNGLQARLDQCGADGVVPGPEFTVDAVLMGYGFFPSNEILRALGASQTFDRAKGQLITVRDANCQTNVAGLYGVGDCCGLGGAQAAREEGVIAATAALRSLGLSLLPPLAAAERASRARLQRCVQFQKALWSLFTPAAGPAEPTPETLICRCEQVSHQRIEEVLAEGAASIGEVKRQTRAGMGRCQGRYCAVPVAALIAERIQSELSEDALFAPRPPIKPVRISDLVNVEKPAR